MRVVTAQTLNRAAGAVLLLALVFVSMAVVCSDQSDAVSDDFSVDGLNYAVVAVNSVNVIGPESDSVTEITIPPSVTYNGTSYNVVGIKERAFENRTSLTSVTVSSTVGTVGDYAFSGCSSLSSVKFAVGTKVIGAGAFMNCTSLTGISFPDTVISAGNYAFKGCTSLGSVELGSGITSISYQCFSGCTSLASFVLGEKISSVSADAFSGCTSLVRIDILNPVFSDSNVSDNSFALGTVDKPVICKVNCAAYPATYSGKGTNEYTTFAFNGETVFTLTLNLYGDVTKTFKGCAGTSITIDGTPAKDYTPEREGYTFRNWSETLPDLMPAKDLTISAVWDARANTVTFDPNEGIGDLKTQIVNSGDSALLREFSELGFDSESGVFKCWSDKADGTGNTYDDHTHFSTLCDITLYAIWTEQPYQVTFDKNNDKATGEMLKQPFGTEAKKLRENSFILTGYKFAGWGSSSGSTEPVADPYTATASVTLYAIWIPITYTVVFDPNGGKGSIDEIVMTYDVPVKLPETKMSRTGYLMTGWSLSPSDNITAYKPGDSVVNLTSTDGVKVTLYSTWSANIYTIIFHPNNSEATGTMDPQFVRYDSTVSLTANAFQYKFYDFCGWSTVEGGTAVEYGDKASVKNLLTEGQMDLYAVWKVGQYHIIYDPGDGDGDLMDFPWVTYFEEYIIPACTYTYSNHNFKGWLCEVDHKIYQPGDVVENLSDGYYQIILTAQWEFDYSLWVPIIGSILGLVVICGASVVFLRRQHRN